MVDSGDILHGNLQGEHKTKVNRGAVIVDGPSSGDHLTNQPATTVRVEKGKFNFFKWMVGKGGRKVVTHTTEDVTPAMVVPKESPVAEVSMVDKAYDLRDKVRTLSNDPNANKAEVKFYMRNLTRVLNDAVRVDASRGERELGRQDGIGEVLANIQFVLLDQLGRGRDDFPLPNTGIKVKEKKVEGEDGERKIYEISVKRDGITEIISYTAGMNASKEEEAIMHIKGELEHSNDYIREGTATLETAAKVRELALKRDRMVSNTLQVEIPESIDGRDSVVYIQPSQSVLTTLDGPKLFEGSHYQYLQRIIRRPDIKEIVPHGGYTDENDGQQHGLSGRGIQKGLPGHGNQSQLPSAGGTTPIDTTPPDVVHAGPASNKE